MAKFVDLKEAAGILGVSADELTEMRSRGDIFGYRDGSSWKFKIEEVERVQQERGASGSGLGSGIIGASEEDFDELLGSNPSLASSGGLSGINIGGPSLTGSSAPGDSADESILVSEDALGGSAVKRGSTIIGKDGGKGEKEDSDLKLAGSSLESNPPLSSPGNLSSGLSSSGSDLSLGMDSSLSKQESDSGESLDLDLGKMNKKGGGMTDASISMGDQSLGDMSFGDDSIDLDAEMGKKGPGSTGVGSDVSIAGGESGINISNPADSGLSLEEEPLDLGGSNIDDLSLPEDDQIIALEDSGELDAATQIKTDEDFSLSPSQEVTAGDDSDSGSQVIALEDSASFDQSSATMLNQGAAGLVADDSSAQPFDSTGFSPEMMAGAGAATATAAGYAPMGYVPAEPAEAPYSIWQVLFLMMAASTLLISGLLMWDITNFMWSFPGNEPNSTVVMEALVSAAGFAPK